MRSQHRPSPPQTVMLSGTGIARQREVASISRTKLRHFRMEILRGVPLRMTRGRTRASFCGFTLIEVLMTMLLLSILVPVIMEGLSLSLHAASSSRHKTEAANLAQDELNQLISAGTWANNPRGDFGADHPEYTWDCQSVAEDYGVSEVRLTVTWAEQGQPRQLVVSTFAQTNPVLPGTDPSTLTQ